MARGVAHAGRSRRRGLDRHLFDGATAWRRHGPRVHQLDGGHALATLLGNHGVEVVVADSIADVEAAARPDSLLLVAQTQYLVDNALLDRLAKAPGDLLLVAPTSRTRTALTPQLRIAAASPFNSQPNCTLREANRAGSVQWGPSDTYQATGDLVLTSCYGGALVRFRAEGRTITVVGSSNFMTNGGLLPAGNAALAMNLAGNRPRLVWYAPDHIEGGNVFSVISFRPDSGERALDHLAIVAGGALGGTLERPADRSTGGRGVTRCDPRVGDCRGSRSVVPIPSGA